MPSTVRQKLPVDMWHCQSYRKHSNGSPHPVWHAQNIHASPHDSSQVDNKYKFPSNPKYICKFPKNNFRKQKNSKIIPKRGCIKTLTAGLSDLEESNRSGRMKTSELSDIEKPEGDMYVGRVLCHAPYAVDSFIAPDPGQLPLPPLEWLQFSSKPAAANVGNHMRLQTALCCLSAV